MSQNELVNTLPICHIHICTCSTQLVLCVCVYVYVSMCMCMCMCVWHYITHMSYTHLFVSNTTCAMCACVYHLCEVAKWNSQVTWLVCCSALQCVALCCGVLQCVAVCCSVLQCVSRKIKQSSDMTHWYFDMRHMCDTSCHSCVWHDSFICTQKVTLIYTLVLCVCVYDICVKSHNKLVKWHDWLIFQSDLSDWYFNMTHMSNTTHMSLVRMCDITHSCVWHINKYVWYHAFMCVAQCMILLIWVILHIWVV